MQDEEIIYTRLSEQELLDYCEHADEKVLAAHVVVFRHLGINKREAIACMAELMKRKENGNEFDFNLYIQEQLKTMPSAQPSETQRNIFMTLLKSDLSKI